MVDYIVIFDYTVDIIFVIDLIMGFFTSVIDTKGFISFDSRVIAKVYTSQFRFYADFLSIFANDRCFASFFSRQKPGSREAEATAIAS